MKLYGMVQCDMILVQHMYYGMVCIIYNMMVWYNVVWHTTYDIVWSLVWDDIIMYPKMYNVII